MDSLNEANSERRAVLPALFKDKDALRKEINIFFRKGNQQHNLIEQLSFSLGQTKIFARKKKKWVHASFVIIKFFVETPYISNGVRALSTPRNSTFCLIFP